MKNFLSSIFSSCLGTLLALVLIILILTAIGSGILLRSNPDIQVKENSVLKLEIPKILPEQSNNRNIPIQNFTLDNRITLGLHDLAKTIRHAAKDPKIKGIYLVSNECSHGYATLQVIRNALLDFKQEGKFIISYNNFIDHRNYYLLSVAENIFMHPLGWLDLKGMGLSLTFIKEFLDKIGVDANVYYAGEFKSATEPFRFNKMSPQNRLQLHEYLEQLYSLYLKEVSDSRDIPYDSLKSNFDHFHSHSPQLALSNNIIDSIAYETDAFAFMQKRIGLQENDKIEFVKVQDYFEKTKDEQDDYSSSNRIAVLFAEGNIIDAQGKEGQIGRKYLNLLRDIRTTKSIKGLVLRVNSGGGSALMSDEFLKEIDLIRSQGKPVVVSMGDYAASGGYYIACHSDSIFASPYTLTGSIGVFALILNFTKLTGDKIGMDADTVGTGPMANKFHPSLPWGEEESKIIQANVDNTYERFISVISAGRNMEHEKVREIAKGRIWGGQKAVELGLVNKLGTLQDAIFCVARMATLDKYRISEFPSQKDPIQKMLEKMQGKDEDESSILLESYLKNELGVYYTWYEEMQYYKNCEGMQMRLPFIIKH